MITIWTGCLMDCIFGDPRRLWHPVRGIGALIAGMERLLRGRSKAGQSRSGEMAAGVCLVLVVCGVTGGAVTGILYVADLFHPAAGWIIRCVMCWQLLAAKSLKTESMKVYDALREGDLEKARTAVSMIVGRDTEHLTGEQIVKAAVETVAENTSDGVIAPLFYLVIGGPTAGFLYKAVNTMDSMVGYHSEKYEYFGRAAARLDDLLNLLPARLSALLMVAAAYLLGYDGAGAWRIFKRDRYCHKSPNSAQTEAVCAGALGLLLAGDASYFGVVHHKPLIGDERKKAEYEDIRHANRLMYMTFALAIGLTVILAVLSRQHVR